MKIKPEEVQTFRGATTRRNIAYSVHEYANESDETDAICKLVGEKLEQYAAPAKIIVQESGRGGQDGERSEAIVMMPAGRQEELQKKIARAKARTQPWKIQSCVMRPWETKQVEWEKMERFLSGSRCRRIYLDSEMDDQQDWKRCKVGEERCDVCEKDDAMVEDREARQAAYVEEQRVIQEQAAQAERKRQGLWVDSGINVPSSSMNILVPSSEVLVPRSVIVTSP
ncbi:hypothetical protein VE02_10082 [Pseudogymnoascus sp. 03VT05]|nr:hypothetical protein VE02_10082 [Pseudogymnoascus sp. 03VT05]